MLISPTRHAPLNIIPLTASHEIICLQQEHEREMETYRDCDAVERLLKKLIVNAINEDYLDEITDQVTYSINLPISGILTHLFRTYGGVEAEKVQEEEMKLLNYFWDPS